MRAVTLHVQQLRKEMKTSHEAPMRKLPNRWQCARCANIEGGGGGGVLRIMAYKGRLRPKEVREFGHFFVVILKRWKRVI